MSHRTAVTCALVVVAFHAAPASAHAVKVDQKLVGTELVIVAYFDTDLPADDAMVTLRGADGNVVATGKTDDTGTWKCPKPAPGTYQLRVKVFDTHEQTVPVEIESRWPTGRAWIWLAVVVATIVVLGTGLWVLRKRRKRPTATTTALN
jgi:hypothetical protein